MAETAVAEEARAQVTMILSELAASGQVGDVPDRLFPVVYAELRRLADAYLRRERADHTLQATELVHEAYVKLVDHTQVEWQDRTHFFAVAAQAMRRLLVDHARKRSREKRGGGRERVTLYEEIHALPGLECSLEDLLSLDDALTELAELDPRQARVVEMRCFAGLKVEEVAVALDVSRRTVEGDWTHAKAWLKRRLSARGSA